MSSKLRQDAGWGMFLVRLVLGSTLLLHGLQKFGLFGGKGLAAFTSNLPADLPPFLGYLAAGFEVLGGALVLLGIVPELGALLILPVMLVAAFVAHWGNGYFSSNKGFEYPLNLALLAIAVIIGGGGRLLLFDGVAKLRARALPPAET